MRRFSVQNLMLNISQELEKQIAFLMEKMYLIKEGRDINLLYIVEIVHSGINWMKT